MDSTTERDEFLSRYKIPLAMGLVGAVLLLGGILSSGIIPKTFLKSSKDLSAGGSAAHPLIVKVDVSGAVIKPGVYNLRFDARIEEALQAAGGVSESADPAYLTKNINLAQKVSDGMKIYIPQAQEAGQTATPAIGGASTLLSDPVNINNASLAQLDQLPGVGAVTAQNIISKRPFGSIEELLIKKAVSRSVYEKIKGLVSVY